MKKKPKLKKELIQEVAQLQERVKELESETAEEKQTQELYQTDEEKYRLFHEAKELAKFNEGSVLQDAEGIITFVNPAAAKMLDYTAEEWIGKHWTVP